MSEFLRDIKITISSVNIDTTGNSTVETVYNLPLDIHVSGEVVKTTLGYPSNATIELYNLNDVVKDMVSAKGSLIKITGGFKTDTGVLSEIFNGTIQNAQTVRGSDLSSITTVYALDGGSWLEGDFSKAYSGAHSLKDVLSEVALSFTNIIGVDWSRASTFIAKGLLIRNMTLDGATKNIMKTLTNTISDGVSAELLYYIEDNVVYFSDRIGLQDALPTFNINHPSQIIGTPTIDYAMLSLKTHFNPSILPDQTIAISNVRSSAKVGNFFYGDLQEVQSNIVGSKRIVEVHHTFDNRGNEWGTAIKARV